MQSLILLLSQDLECVERFVKRHLGPIEAVDKRAELLLDTLEAYLAHGQRPANASARCACHTDTVHNRLLEIEHALGCKVEERSLELALALRLRPLVHGSISGETARADSRRPAGRSAISRIRHFAEPPALTGCRMRRV